MKQVITSNSPQQTHKIAKNFIEKISLKKPKINTALVFILEGELGAGKTEFIKGIAKALGVREKINSPTFVIMKVFQLKGKNFDYLWHLDLYRIKKIKELDPLGFKDLLKDKRNLIFIEWGNKVKKLLPKKHGEIKIKILGEKQRKIEISIP